MNEALPLVIANIKANKTWEEIEKWLDQVADSAANFSGTVIFCPSYPFLPSAAKKIKTGGLKIKLGAQDISRFEQGAYTGEVAASQLGAICQYAIIGHSERRKNLKETDQDLQSKVKNAKNANIEPIFCVQDENTKIPNGVKIVAYEPVFAIGTGNPDTPENAKSMSGKLKSLSEYVVIYGGSVTSANVKSFLEKDVLDGVLVGGASLDASEFIKILESATY